MAKWLTHMKIKFYKFSAKQMNIVNTQAYTYIDSLNKIKKV